MVGPTSGGLIFPNLLNLNILSISCISPFHQREVSEGQRDFLVSQFRPRPIFNTSCPVTIIGAEAFHFSVRNGPGFAEDSR